MPSVRRGPGFGVPANHGAPFRPARDPGGLKQELLETARRELGPVAVIGDLNFVSLAPKTRSGKIMRRVLKAIVLDRDPGDISTIEDEGSIEEAREACRRLREEIKTGLTP